MTQNKLVKPLLLAVGLPLLYLADVSPEAPLGLTLVRDAHAIVGAPLTPRLGGRRGAAHDLPRGRVRRRGDRSGDIGDGTAAGRHGTATVGHSPATVGHGPATGRRGQKPPAPAAAPAPAGTPAVGSIVNTLPAGCTQEAKGGVEYQRCGNVYYRAAFQGNSLVYVVQQP